MGLCILLMNEFKISENRTGTLFYTRIGEGQNKPYRVRFKSFQLGVYENRPLIESLENLQNNYNVFKYCIRNAEIRRWCLGERVGPFPRLIVLRNSTRI